MESVSRGVQSTRLLRMYVVHSTRLVRMCVPRVVCIVPDTLVTKLNPNPKPHEECLAWCA
jgi:hypothetical protein